MITRKDAGLDAQEKPEFHDRGIKRTDSGAYVRVDADEANKKILAASKMRIEASNRAEKEKALLARNNTGTKPGPKGSTPTESEGTRAGELDLNKATQEQHEQAASAATKRANETGKPAHFLAAAAMHQAAAKHGNPAKANVHTKIAALHHERAAAGGGSSPKQGESVGSGGGKGGANQFGPY